MPAIGKRFDYSTGWDGFEFRLRVEENFIDVEVPFLRTSFYFGPLPQKQHNHDGQPHAQPQNHTEAGSGAGDSPSPERSGE